MKKRLSQSAYGGVDGNKYVPYVTDKNNKGGSSTIMIMGAILAVIFAASTAYSGMKAGLTVAAGIPGSIIGSGMVGVFAKKKGILGKNLLQGMSSGGESIASGMIYVLPAIIIIGGKVNFIAGIAVGALAVLFAIGSASLVQNYLVVEEHGKLVYPESMAISEALVASEAGGDSLKFMGIGFGIGGILTILTTQVFGWVNSMITYVGSSFYRWKMSTEVNPMLAGIGFVVGLEVALVMFAGSVLSNFAITPLIAYFTQMAGSSSHVWNDAAVSVSQMSVDQVAGSYSKYIGAGMMLCGGIVGAVKLIPVIITSVKKTLNARNSEDSEKNTLGIWALLIGTIAIFVVGFFISGNFLMAIVAGILSLLLALLFVIVSARLAGTIGCSNAPVSGMTIASLVIMTLVFVIFGWTNTQHSEILLLFGVFIVTAISVGGAYMQTQKVNYVIGGNNNEMMKYFMIAAMIGVIVVVGTTVILEPQLRITGSNPPFGMPQANLIATLTSGIMSGNLPWIMIIVGVVMALVCWMLGLSIMTVALGFYLPMSTTSIILVGALVKLLIENSTKEKELKERRVQSGVSLSSGLIAGGSIIGLIGIILHVTGVLGDVTPGGFAGSNEMGLILLVVLVVSMILPLINIKKDTKTE
ncbi:OPT/YSL family transporter [Companilactobacillus allii]|uniref:Peptide transporter n=1 Tax=Companilactobacillus allii TaxID=1847728 RepID=A0A1P8Q1V1_9LACO|nr:OPT/YSL family transporter [Companilactobacillus allii]APX71854.1 peptide transporter [Companilactobacillus allii]USQ68942.1 OPT/YSL family transporter [Companilactobacillus allii]